VKREASVFSRLALAVAAVALLASCSAQTAIQTALSGREGRKSGWFYSAAALMTTAIAAALTRNAMVGLFAGAFTLLALRSPWAGAAAPALAAIAIALAPSHIQQRVLSVTDLRNDTNRERLYLWSAGMRIARDHPFFGVGQNSFPLVYPKYRHPDAKEPNISHLHNNVIEIAAERGVAGLLAWTSIWAVALWKTAAAWRMTRWGEFGALAAMGISSITAFLAAGMFEYNFGAAVTHMLIYFFMAASLASAKKIESTQGKV
jgi:O-antigen ligase